jgi:hypothetical protein
VPFHSLFRSRIPLANSTHLVDDPDLTEEGGDTVGGTALDVLYVVGLWHEDGGWRGEAKWGCERTRVGSKQIPSACAVRRAKIWRGYEDRAEDGCDGRSESSYLDADLHLLEARPRFENGKPREARVWCRWGHGARVRVCARTFVSRNAPAHNLQSLWRTKTGGGGGRRE